MAGRFLQIFRPISRIMPDIEPPQRVVKFREKLLWTGIVLALYLVMSEVPLYGVGLGGGWQLAYLRVIFASNRGSLMELGIGPIVTAGLILQLLAGSGIIACDFSNPDDRSLFSGASKVVSLLIICVQASAYLIGGVYGSLDWRVGAIIFVELIVAGLVLMMLDEIMQKGWGIGSGISLFILAGVARTILWSSVLPIRVGDGKSYGAVLALIQTILKGEPVSNAFVRSGNLPNMLQLIATIGVFLLVIYIEGVRVELPIAHARFRGFRGRYPIKFLYVSNLPVIFASTLFADIYVVSQLLYNRFPTNFLVKLLGVYEGGELVGGLAYYVISPRSISEVIVNPLRALVFMLIMISFCVVFSLTWLEVGGVDPRTVAKQLIDAGMQIPGFRRSHKPIEMLLKRYIPVVAVLGGVTVGIIASIGDFFGVFGTGMGVLLSVGILYQYSEILMKEQLSEMYPALGRFIGE